MNSKLELGRPQAEMTTTHGMMLIVMGLLVLFYRRDKGGPVRTCAKPSCQAGKGEIASEPLSSTFPNHKTPF